MRMVHKERQGRLRHHHGAAARNRPPPSSGGQARIPELAACASAEELLDAGGLRGSVGIKGTDVTAENNCAGMQWFNHDSSKDTAKRLKNRLQYSAANNVRISINPDRPNTLLGGGVSDVEPSWTTTQGAAFSPRAVVPGAAQLANGTIFGGKQERRDRQRPSVASSTQYQALKPELAACGDAEDLLGNGIKGTDVTAEQNCARMQWFNHDSSKDSPGKLQRRLQYMGLEEDGEPRKRSDPDSMIKKWTTTQQSSFPATAKKSAAAAGQAKPLSSSMPVPPLPSARGALASRGGPPSATSAACFSAR